MNMRAGVVLLCAAALLGVLWLSGRGSDSDAVSLIGGCAALAAVLGFVAIIEAVVRRDG